MIKIKVNNELKDVKQIFTKKDSIMEQVKKIYKTQNRLPAEYQEIEYITSTGTQYFSEFLTIPSDANSVEIKAVTRTANPAEQCLVGHASYSIEFGYSSETNRQFFYILDSVAYISTESNLNRKNTFIMKADEDKYSFATDLDNGSYEESSEHNVSQLQGRPLHLLTYRTGSVRYPFVGDVFSVEVKINNIMTMNLMPCYRKSDNEIGLYDLVNDIFYTNNGTGTFTKGNDVNFIKVFDSLPTEYQEVEYIATDGNSYLDTGIIPDITKTYDFYCDWYGVHSGDQVILGTRMDTGNTRFFLFASCPSEGVLYSNMAYTTYNYGYEQRISLNTKLKCTTHFEQGSQSWKEESQNTQSSRRLSFPEGFVFTKSLYLFRNNYTSPNPCFNGTRVYMLKGFENGKLVLNLIPCYRKSDNEIGMYDIVTKTFLTNIGTGTFIKGDDVL